MLTDTLSILKSKYIPEGSYRGNFVTITTGKILSQVIPVLLVPVLTRLYTPSDFGVFAIFLAVIGVVSFISNGRYNIAIILPKKEEDVIRLFSISVIINTFVLIILSLVVFLFGDVIASFLNLDVPSIVLYLIPVGIFLVGLFEPLYHLGLRRKLFKVLATGLVCKFTLIVLLKIAFAFFEIGSLCLILGHIVGYGIGIFLLIALLFYHKAFLKFRKSTRSKELFNLAKIYKKFPMYSMPSDFLNEIARQLPHFLLNSFFGSVIVGQYSLTQRVLQSPITTIAGGIRDAFKEKASRDYREKGSCRKVFVDTLKKSSLFSIVPFVLLFIFAPVLVPIIFGPEWAPAGDYIRILTLLFFLRFIVSPLSTVLFITGKQVYKLIWEFFAVSSIIISFWVGFVYYDEYIALGIYSFSLSFLYIILLLISYNFAIRRNEEN